MSNELANSQVMLYDGVCGLCNHGVQFVIKYDKRGTLRFAPIQSNYAQAIIARHPELQGVDSVIMVDNVGSPQERVHIRSTAALEIARYLGGIWRLGLIGYILPRFLRDFFYDLVAKNRYKFFGKHDTCMLPSPAVRNRFLDLA